MQQSTGEYWLKRANVSLHMSFSYLPRSRAKLFDLLWCISSCFCGHFFSPHFQLDVGHQNSWPSRLPSCSPSHSFARLGRNGKRSEQTSVMSGHLLSIISLLLGDLEV